MVTPMSPDNLHGVNAPNTHKIQITFRGSEPADGALWSAVKARAKRDGVNYVDVIREALRRYLGL